MNEKKHTIKKIRTPLADQQNLWMNMLVEEIFKINWTYLGYCQEK
jgi:hypothetical protein